MKFSKKLTIILFFLIHALFCANFIFSSLEFIPPTPENLELLDEGSNVTLNASISNFNLQEFILNFNSNNEKYYSSNLILMLNLNNNSQLNENSSHIIDSSLYSNNGFFQGDTEFSTFSRFGGGSVYFDGNNDWIEIPDDESLDGMNQFTFEAWLFKESTDTEPRGIASKRISASNPGRSWSIFAWNDGYVNFDIINDRHNSGVAFPRNRWVHLTVTFDGTAPSDERKKFYYDGELVATTASSQTNIPRNSNSDLTIGILNKEYGVGWEGYIDEVRIWDIVLSEEEIAQRFKSNFQQINASSWLFETQKKELQSGIYFYDASISNSTNTISTNLRSFIIGSSFVYLPPTAQNNSILFQNFIEINTTIVNLQDRTIQINIFNSSGLVESSNFTSAPAFLNSTNLEFGEYTFNAKLFDETDTITEVLENRTIILSGPLEIDLEFTSPTPNNLQTILGNSTLLNLSISTESLDFLQEFSFSFNSTQYSLYDSSLVAMFNLDNNALIGETNSLAIDSSLYSNHASISGASWSSNGVYENALSFSGGSHSLTLNSFSEFSGESQVTIMGWIKQNSLSQDQYFLWADGNVLIELGSTQGTTGSDILRVRWNLDGTWRNNHYVIGGLETDVWNHWTVVFDSGNTFIYKNGELVTTGTDSQSTISTNSPNYVFGTRSGDNLDGFLDEIKMYTRVLDSQEIMFHYNSRLKQEDMNNWSFEYSTPELENGTYPYSAQVINSVNEEFLTPLRFFNVGIESFNISILQPLSNSQFLNTQQIQLELNSSTPLEYVGFYINGDDSIITPLQTLDSILWFSNTTIFQGGISTITFVYNTSSSPLLQEEVSVNIIQTQHSKVTKKLNSLGGDIYTSNISFEPVLPTSITSRIFDFISQLFNFYSFSQFPIETIIEDSLFNGTLLEFNYISTTQNTSIEYAITPNSNTSTLLDLYIVGLE